MGFGKFLRRAVGLAAPLAGLIPGVGLPAAIALGAGGGILSGGGLRGALAGGLGAAAFNPGIAGVGSALGASGAAARGLGAGLAGAGAGGATGGLKGALLGGAAGGLGGYYAGGGFDGLGEKIFGSAAGTPLSGGLQGPTQGSGVLGSVTRGLSDVGVNLGGGGSSYGGGNTGGSSYNNLSTVLGGLSSISANNRAEKDLLNARQQALTRYQPYVDARFNPGDLTQDPGYQFRLQQGQQAIDRSLGARGKQFSGEALKAAQDYGQGLADSTYNEAYNRWLQQNAQNIGVAGSLADLDTQGGNVRANAGVNNSNVLNRTLSSLLGGYGAYTNTGASQNNYNWLFDPRTGQRLYA